MDADKIKNKRKALKSSATKFVNNLNTILVNETNVHSLEIVYNQLIEKIDCLKIADNELLSVIDVKDIEKEVEQCESFMENLISYKCKISQKIASLTPPILPPTIVNTTNLPSSTIQTLTHEPRSSIKLPKLTVNKFYGDHKNWIFSQHNSHKNTSDTNSLRKLYDRAETEIRNLESLGINSESYDDVLGGQTTVASASVECVQIFNEANIPLHKWATNSAELRELWEKNGFSIETSSNSIGQNMINYKVLGISWDTDRDVFYFDIEGFIAPYVIRLKILIQNIWEMGLLWDQEMLLIIKKPFNEWCHELKDLHLVSIPRFYDFTDSNATNIQLHCFSDSSKKAYGTVIYFRVISTDGTITTSFVTSKSRVAPLKTLSLPKLELMGTLLSARFLYRLPLDSQGESFRFKPFVKNRIEDIQKLTEPSKWHHCPGKENPADIISRGISVRGLKDSELWWHGPPWLQQAEQFWPKFEKQNVSNLDLELKSKFRDISQNEIILENREKLLSLDKFSSYFKLLRVTAFVFRYINNTRDILKKSGTLETEELKKSEEYWIKEIQNETYASEIIDLEKAQKVSDCSKIRSLVPCLDYRKILRIKGRLDESELSLDEKQPILLSSNSKFTELLILKYSLKQANQITAQLPRDRLLENPPFEICGLDFTGPILYKCDKEVKKCYFAVTRGIHLELVSSMSTKHFLFAFRRFISRRGSCSVVYSDNAKSFKAASKDLIYFAKILKNSEFKDFISSRGITWKFIVERAPWWDGFYERLVKSVKDPLRKFLAKLFSHSKNLPLS
ncbi:integrase catalytic domain-containing protein [Trichonephila clavipes]|uniref:Integrase catalytic domain-containing protein n=1 Tax=Trichonephila clavipes TaxID=2585209 RepID=A0A8X6S6G4_TRICX|nr:integrase catalytic domain-containing protein [Trichonephila clavipes]